jgi:hypothetical protein
MPHQVSVAIHPQSMIRDTTSTWTGCARSIAKSIMLTMLTKIVTAGGKQHENRAPLIPGHVSHAVNLICEANQPCVYGIWSIDELDSLNDTNAELCKSETKNASFDLAWQFLVFPHPDYAYAWHVSKCIDSHQELKGDLTARFDHWSYFDGKTESSKRLTSSNPEATTIAY